MPLLVDSDGEPALEQAAPAVADAQSPPHRYPRREHHLPKRYQHVSAIRTHRPYAMPPAVPVKTANRPPQGPHFPWLLLIFVIGLLAPVFALPAEPTLADQLGPAYLCAHGVSGTIFSFGKEPRCVAEERLEPVQRITVIPYFKQSMGPIFNVWSCALSIETVDTYTSFFNGKGIIGHSLTYRPVDPKSCRALTSDLELNPKLLFQISSYTWTNDSTPLTAEYQWCCRTKRTAQYRLIIRRYTANINYVTNKMFSAGVQMQRCDPWTPTASCELTDQSLIWGNNSFTHCNFIPGIAVAAERRGDDILSEEGQFAVHLTGVRKLNTSCDTTSHLLETYEGMFLSIVHVKRTVLRPPTGINKTTTEFATIAYVERSLEITIQNLFTTNYLNICNVQRSRYYYLRSLAMTNPTLVARALLQTQHVTAKLTGQYLTVWQCIRTSIYKLRFITNDACYDDIPITYTLNNIEHDAFLTTSDFQIVARSYPKKCSSMSLHFLFNQLCWDGKNVSTCDIHPTELIFMDSFPKLRQMRLNIAQVHDASAEALNTVTRLLDVETGLQALARLFEMTATDAAINPAELKQLAISAGITTVDYVSSTLKRVVNYFVPSWLIYLSLTAAILVVTLLVIYLYAKYLHPYCIHCVCALPTLFRSNRHLSEPMSVTYNVAAAEIASPDLPPTEDTVPAPDSIDVVVLPSDYVDMSAAPAVDYVEMSFAPPPPYTD
jgi:hypothetical protein